ncbi:nitroreductase family protein [Actinomycetospora endophytica]|uniref:Nitroreductase family protein n=1 Tax=Actinomycetospora endophytica TaxID=2291215 RepID=A0ABS8PI45_9PSEU|nr:nitroreductase family protein [Actinomycetospora endophytica]MCD2197941.1 nitroreductase family protein [Actinomycetospora endophytica]
MSDPAPQQVDLLEGLRTTPSRRYLAETPIPDAVLWELLDTAIRGPSGGNRQQWGWIVVTDADVKARIASWYRQAWENAYGVRRAELTDPSRVDAEIGLTPASFRAADHLAEHLAEAPVFIVPVLRNAADSTDKRLGSSIYGAVQHLLLAARAYGIGGVLTTLHLIGEQEVNELLGLPDDVATMGLVPLGYPARGRWSVPRRQPVEEVVHWERWGRIRARRPDGA